MNQHVRNLKDLSDNLVGVLDEVSRLEFVNQNLYEINNKKLMEMDELQKDMKDHVELLFQDVLTSNNLLTLKTDIDLQRDKFLELGRKAPPANLIW